MTKIKLTKGQRNLLEVGAGAGLVLGTFTLGFGTGATIKFLIDKVRNRGAVSVSGNIFGEDPILELAKRL